MTEAQKQAMRAGKKRAAARRQEHARQRVTAYKDWLTRERRALGTPSWREVFAGIPEIPSDLDYRLARAA